MEQLDSRAGYEISFSFAILIRRYRESGVNVTLLKKGRCISKSQNFPEATSHRASAIEKSLQPDAKISILAWHFQRHGYSEIVNLVRRSIIVQSPVRLAIRYGPSMVQQNSRGVIKKIDPRSIARNLLEVSKATAQCHSIQSLEMHQHLAIFMTHLGSARGTPKLCPLFDLKRCGDLLMGKMLVRIWVLEGLFYLPGKQWQISGRILPAEHFGRQFRKLRFPSISAATFFGNPIRSQQSVLTNNDRKKTIGGHFLLAEHGLNPSLPSNFPEGPATQKNLIPIQKFQSWVPWNFAFFSQEMRHREELFSGGPNGVFRVGYV